MHPSVPFIPLGQQEDGHYRICRIRGCRHPSVPFLPRLTVWCLHDHDLHIEDAPLWDPGLVGLRGFRRSDVSVIRVLGWWGILATALAILVYVAVPPERMHVALQIEATVVAIFLGLGLRARLDRMIGTIPPRHRDSELHELVATYGSLAGGASIILILAYFLLPMYDIRDTVGSYAFLSGVILTILGIRLEHLLTYRRDRHELGARDPLDRRSVRQRWPSAFAAGVTHFLFLVVSTVLWVILGRFEGFGWLENKVYMASWIAIYAGLMFVHQLILVGRYSRTGLRHGHGKTLSTARDPADDDQDVGWLASAVRATCVVAPILLSCVIVVILTGSSEIPANEIPGLISAASIVSYACLWPASLVHPSRQGFHDILARTLPRRV